MKKTLSVFFAAVVAIITLAGCGGNTGNDTITVLSREDGSGTRGAFIELFGIEEKDADGNKVDNTITTAEITNSTSVMMTSVAGNKAAIGYTSLGALNDSVKTLKVDGAEATAENVKLGDYKVSRPFNIAVLDESNAVSSDFIAYILSEEGQTIVEDNGYISNGNTGAFTGGNVSGEITVGGSSSVTPLMEKLVEAYSALNTNAKIQVQQSDSSTGMSSTIDGTYDIGMASRELKESETDAGLVSTAIAIDGIAVIVNKDNALENITSEQVKGIYTGEITLWSEVK